jgi:hypothetical protein
MPTTPTTFQISVKERIATIFPLACAWAVLTWPMHNGGVFVDGDSAASTEPVVSAAARSGG